MKKIIVLCTTLFLLSGCAHTSSVPYTSVRVSHGYSPYYGGPVYGYSNYGYRPDVYVGITKRFKGYDRRTDDGQHAAPTRLHRDIDHDGIPNRADHDIDGDGIPNNKDRVPNNRRYR